MRKIIFLVSMMFLLGACGGQSELVVEETAVVQPSAVKPTATSEPAPEPTAKALPTVVEPTIEPTLTATPSAPTPEPTSTPRPILEAQLGDNHSILPPDRVDVWHYAGKAGELLFINFVLEESAEEIRNDSLLSPSIAISAPNKSQLATIIRNPGITNTLSISDAYVHSAPLPEDGIYEIAVRSYSTDKDSVYTLFIESKRTVVAADILEDYAGAYREEEFDINSDIRVEGDILIQEIGQNTLELIPISETEFLTTVEGGLTVFVRNEEGVVTGYAYWNPNFSDGKVVWGDKLMQEP